MVAAASVSYGCDVLNSYHRDGTYLALFCGGEKLGLCMRLEVGGPLAQHCTPHI